MRLLLTIALLLPTIAHSDDPADEEIRLSVKPLLCITDNRNPSCDMSFLVVWHSREAGYYCLFSDLSEAPARCWVEEQTGELRDDRIVTESFSYWMASRNTDNPDNRLAEVTVEVLRMDSDDRRRRRRTRHVWDIN